MRTWMKWMVWAGVSLPSMTVWAEVPEERAAWRTVLLAHPGLTGEVGVGVEQAVGERVALSATVRVLASFNALRWEESGAGYTSRQWGLGVDPGVHVYLTGRAPEGLWVGPHVELFGAHVSNRNDVVSEEGSQSVPSGWRSFTYGASARLGYTVILAPGFSAQVALGVTGQRTHALLPGGTGASEGGSLRSWTVAPRTTLAVGWAF